LQIETTAAHDQHPFTTRAYVVKDAAGRLHKLRGIRALVWTQKI
jgi:hypothetical protein